MELTIDTEPSVLWGLLLNASSKPVSTITLIYVFFIAVLLLFSALASASEVAYFSLTEKKLEDEKSKFQSVINLMRKPKRLLATILILNNAINIGIVILTTSLTELYFKSSDYKIILAVSFSSTFLIVFFGEVLPKVYANQNSKSIALMMHPILNFFSFLFYPFSWFMIKITSLIEKNIHTTTAILTKEDFNKALEITAEKEITKEEKEILKGIINFSTISVKQIMHSRIDIFAFDKDLTYHELMDKINKYGYSRYPVYNETIDTITGILYVKDLLKHTGEDEKFDWQSLQHEAFFVPESKKIDDLLKDFQEKKIHMAIVVDEYGGTSGLITLEDLIEEIVGEINDEFDEDEASYSKIADGVYVFEGKTSIHDFCKILGSDPSIFDEIKGENESLGGLMLELFSRIPRASDAVSFKDYNFTIQSVSTKRVKRIKVELKNIKQNVV